jgi:hypothetical protein
VSEEGSDHFGSDVAGAEAMQKVNPKPKWAGSSSCLIFISSNGVSTIV